MAELIIKQNGTCDLKFHANLKNYKMKREITYKGNDFILFINKNDSIYDIINKSTNTRDIYFFNKLKGNPSSTAMQKIFAEINMRELIS